MNRVPVREAQYDLATGGNWPPMNKKNVSPGIEKRYARNPDAPHAFVG